MTYYAIASVGIAIWTAAITGILAYARGYSHGVAYCLNKMRSEGLLK